MPVLKNSTVVFAGVVAILVIVLLVLVSTHQNVGGAVDTAPIDTNPWPEQWPINPKDVFDNFGECVSWCQSQYDHCMSCLNNCRANGNSHWYCTCTWRICYNGGDSCASRSECNAGLDNCYTHVCGQM